MLKGALPRPIRSLGWRFRWLRHSEAFDRPLLATARLAAWTLREIGGPAEMHFSAPDGTRFVSMRHNMAGLTVYLANWNEPGIHRFMRAHLRPGDVFVDAGANIGSWSVRAAQWVGPAGRVVSFEAHPFTFGFLRRNAALNNLAQITPFNLAVGAAEGSVTMNFVGHNPGETHIGADGETVRLRRIDDVMAELGIGQADYLKIDVEGFEGQVVEGARDLIARSPRIVVQTEIVAAHTQRYGGQTSAVVALVAAMGLVPHRARRDGTLRVLTAEQAAVDGDVLWRRP